MKGQIKIFIKLLTISVLFITSCNNDIISTSAIEKPEKNLNEINDHRSKSTLKFKIKLEPQETHSFNFDNTGLRVFRSIHVSNCDSIYNDIAIYGYMDDGSVILNCDSDNIAMLSIEITNISSAPINLVIALSGDNQLIPVKQN